MPKRVIDFDALWASDKLASCAEWAQSEYAWLYGLADASGSFELTNLRVIWGRVAAIRKNLSLERLQEIFDEFIARGLLFTWEENGKRYGHWTGSDMPGRLPARSWRARLQKLAPPVPSEGLAAYSARFGGSKEGIVTRAGAAATTPEGDSANIQSRALKRDLEEAQAQDLSLDSDGDLDFDLDLENPVCLPPGRMPNRNGSELAFTEPHISGAADSSIESAAPGYAPPRSTAHELLEIYERERGELPAAGVLTPERRRRCARWLASGFTAEEFRAAVRCAAATPFLAGEGNRGWQASFDWLIANRSNARKVLQGEYSPHGAHGRACDGPRGGQSRAERRAPADLYAGIGPRPADCGVRVNPEALERIRAREAHRLRQCAQDGSASDAGSRCGGEPSFAVPRSPSDLAPLLTASADNAAPKPIAFDAHSRASPAFLNS